MTNVNETMAVGNEKTAQGQKKVVKKAHSIAKKKYTNWIWGVVFSCLPLTALPITMFVKDGNVQNLIYQFCCDVNIVFVGISFTITALNDYIEQERDSKEGFLNLNLFLLLLGAIYYVIVVLEKNNSTEMNMAAVFWVNVGYFVIMFILVSVKYISAIVDEQRCN